MMSEQKVPRSVEQRIVIKFLVGENVPTAEIHHRLQQQYGEECLLRRHSSPLFLSYTPFIPENYTDDVNIFMCLCVDFFQPSNKLTVFH